MPLQAATTKRINLKQHICLNECLSPIIFDASGTMFDTVKTGFSHIANYVWWQNKCMFPVTAPQDIILFGDMAGYLYNKFTEVSLGIVITHVSQELAACFDNINAMLTPDEDAYKFINRSVHCYFLSEIPQNIPSYSIPRQRWLNHPVKRQLNYTIADFCRIFPLYQQTIRENVEACSRYPNGMFTIEGCHQLEAYLQYMRLEAKKALLESEEHEYNPDYLLWRTFCELGGENYFQRYLVESYNYNINELEQC